MFKLCSIDELKTSSDDYYSSKIDGQLEKILYFYTNQWKKYESSTKVKSDEKDVYFPVSSSIYILFSDK